MSNNITPVLVMSEALQSLVEALQKLDGAVPPKPKGGVRREAEPRPAQPRRPSGLG
jgi:hypothetical protein